MIIVSVVICKRDTISLNHVILADNVVGTAIRLLDPPVRHVGIGFRREISVQFLAHVTDRLMVAELSGVEIPPPKVFVELGVIRIEEFQVVRQRFWTEKSKTSKFMDGGQ